MCEMYAFTGKRRITVNDTLKTFFSHSEEHRNGWGLYIHDEDRELLVKEEVKANDSALLKTILSERIETCLAVAHIRYATIGDVCVSNSHPFTGLDKNGRKWVLFHNGTIFDAPVLDKYHYVQEGSTDSERILLYLIDRVNKLDVDASEDRMRLVEDVVATIVPGNKLNLMIHDGEYLYVHKNEPGTLYSKTTPDGIMFSTHPLDDGHWVEVQSNCLQVYEGGLVVYKGRQHDYTYIRDEKNSSFYGIIADGKPNR